MIQPDVDPCRIAEEQHILEGYGNWFWLSSKVQFLILSILFALLTIFVCRDAGSIGGQSKVATVQRIVNSGNIDMIDIVHCGHFAVDTLLEYLASA